MIVSEFISLLEAHKNKQLSYEYGTDFKILPYSHMTEIKNINIESMDCGGSINQWNETVMQLWSGVTQDDGHRVNSSKLLNIINKVATQTQMDLESDFLIEYGDSEHVVAQYNIRLDHATESTLCFKLDSVLSQCKGLSNANSCCSSADSNCCA